MKFICFLAIFIYGGINCSESKPAIKTNDETIIYEFINYFIQRKEMPAFRNNYPLLDRELSHYSLSAKDSTYFVNEKHIFSKDDWSFILKQASQLDSFRIKNELLKGRTVISSDSLRSLDINSNLNDVISLLHHQYGANGVNSLSLPLFSLDRKKVIITYEFIEKGGGMGGVYVFQKDILGWKLLEQLQIWEY